MKFQKTIELRELPHSGSCCWVQKDGSDLKHIFRVSEVSNYGIGLISKQCSFRLGEPIVVHLKLIDGSSLIAAGTVINQRVYFPDSRERHEDAVFRFSVRFDEPVDFSPRIATCDPWA